VTNFVTGPLRVVWSRVTKVCSKDTSGFDTRSYETLNCIKSTMTGSNARTFLH
jgi:hypothetical protein